jgi:hypothetical protein
MSAKIQYKLKMSSFAHEFVTGDSPPGHFWHALLGLHAPVVEALVDLVPGEASALAALSAQLLSHLHRVVAEYRVNQVFLGGGLAALLKPDLGLVLFLFDPVWSSHSIDLPILASCFIH